MKGSEIASLLPQQPSAEREEQIIQFIKDGQSLSVQWRPVKSGNVTFYVAQNALCLGEADDFFRANFTHFGAQRVADLFDARLPTTKIADLTYLQAEIQLIPCTQTPDSQMGHTSRMVQHSDCIEGQRKGREGLCADEGKDWVLTNQLVGRPDRAANFGWHFSGATLRSPGGLPVYQSLGLAHNGEHVDYSQTLRLVNKWCEVDGQQTLLDEVLQHPALCDTVSYEGPLRILRHPGVAASDPLSNLASNSPAGSSSGKTLAALALGAGMVYAAWKYSGR